MIKKEQIASVLQHWATAETRGELDQDTKDLIVFLQDTCFSLIDQHDGLNMKFHPEAQNNLVAIVRMLMTAFIFGPSMHRLSNSLEIKLALEGSVNAATQLVQLCMKGPETEKVDVQ